MQFLTDDHKILYVVTSKPIYFSEQIVKYFGLDRYFTQVIGSELDLTNADKPTLIKLSASTLPPAP